MTRPVRIAAWIGLAFAVFLGARAGSYVVLGPRTALSVELGNEGGGPPLAILAVGIPLLAAALAVAVAALTRLGVAERHRLSGEGAASAPQPLDVAAIARRSAGLTAGSSVLFALIESYVHWRAGLGFHGVHCLLGPVHRDALPFLAALSVLAAAGSVAAAHALAWIRRAAPVAAIARVPALRPSLVILPPPRRPRTRRTRAPGGSRAPPWPGASVNPAHS